MGLSYLDLRKQLARGGVAPVYIVTGEQELLRDLACREIQAAALQGMEGTEAGHSVDRFDGESAPIAEVFGACNLLPLFGDRRVVVVKRADRIIQGEGAEEIMRYLQDPSPHAVLLLSMEKTPDARRKAWKQIESKAIVVHCDPLKERDREAWVADQAARRGLRLKPDVVRYLVEELGSDLRRHLEELEKISLHAADEKTIDVEDLGRLLGRGKAPSVFKLTDAVANRDIAAALRHLSLLLEEGEPPLRVLSLIDGTVGQLLAAKEILSAGRRPAEVARRLGIPSWRAEAFAAQAMGFRERELVRGLESVGRCDRSLKSSGAPPRLLLEGLLVSLCGGPRPGAGRSRRSAGGGRGDLSG